MTTTLHNATAFNASASALNGISIETDLHPVMLVWFTPGGSYNGTATFQVSPDGETTWHAIDGRAASVIETPINAVASPAAGTLYIVPVPSWCFFRVQMSGGSQGTLTVMTKQAHYAGIA